MIWFTGIFSLFLLMFINKDDKGRKIGFVLCGSLCVQLLLTIAIFYMKGGSLGNLQTHHGEDYEKIIMELTFSAIFPFLLTAVVQDFSCNITRQKWLNRVPLADKIVGLLMVLGMIIATDLLLPEKLSAAVSYSTLIVTSFLTSLNLAPQIERNRLM